MKPPSANPRFAALLLAMSVSCTVHASPNSSSAVSQASMVPVAVSVALPVILVAGVGSLMVTGVDASAQGVTWVVENAVDGGKASIRFTGQAIGASALAIGTVITVTATGTGMLLSAAGKVIAFVPNEIGRSLMYDRKVSQ